MSTTQAERQLLIAPVLHLSKLVSWSIVFLPSPMKVPNPPTTEHAASHDSDLSTEGSGPQRSAAPPVFQLAASSAVPPPDENWPAFTPPQVSLDELKAADADSGNRQMWKAMRLLSANYLAAFKPKRTNLPEKLSARKGFVYKVFYFQHVYHYLAQNLKLENFPEEDTDGVLRPENFARMWARMHKAYQVKPQLFQRVFAHFPGLEAQFFGKRRSVASKVAQIEKGVIKKAEPLKSGTLNRYELFRKINGNNAFALAKPESDAGIGALQGLLKEMGHLPEEHRLSQTYNRATRAAIAKFQMVHGLLGIPSVKKGVLGKTTLNALDAAWQDREQSGEVLYSGTQKHLQFNIPVFERLDYQQLMVQSLVSIFGISKPLATRYQEKLGNRLLAIGQQKIGQKSRGRVASVSKSDIARGYKIVTLTPENHAKVLAWLKIDQVDTGGESAPAEEGLQSEMHRQEEREELVLTKQALKIKKAKMEAQRKASRHLNGGAEKPVGGLSDQLKAAQKDQEEISLLEKKIEAERKRLGLTEDEEAQDEGKFIHQFERFAVQTGQGMLSNNLHQVAAFDSKYEKGSKFSSTLEGILIQLSKQYAEADRLKKAALANWLEDAKKRAGMAGKILPDSIIELINGGPAILLQQFLSPQTAQFREWAGKEKEIHQLLAGQVKQFPILAHPDLNVRAFGQQIAGMGAALNAGQLKQWIFGQVKGLLQSTRTAIEGVELTPKNIWSFGPIIDRAKAKMGIAKDSHYAILIQQGKAKAEDKPLWRDALDWGLFVATMLSGPVAWLGAAGGLAVSLSDLNTNVKATQNQRTAGKASMSKEDAIIREVPGWGWLVLDLALLGMDVADAVKAVREMTAGGKKVIGAGKLDADAAAQISEEVAKKTAKNSDIHWFWKFGMKKAGQILNILDKLKDKNLKLRLIAFLKDNRISKAVIGLFDLTKKVPALFGKVIRRLVTAGGAGIKMLPQIMARLVGKLPFDHPLFKEILMNVTVRAYFLHHGLTKTLKHWKKHAGDWVKGGVDGFRDLARKSYQAGMGKLGKDDLVRQFGKGFHEMEPWKQNNLLLMGSHRSKEVSVLLGDGKLGGQLKLAWQKFRDQDLIDGTLNLKEAQLRATTKLDAFLASHVNRVEDFARFQRGGGLVDDALRSSVFAKVAQHEYQLALKMGALKLPGRFPKTPPFQPEAMQKLLNHFYGLGPGGKKRLTIQKGKLKFWDAFHHLMHNPGDDIAAVMGRIRKGERFDYLANGLSKNWKKDNAAWKKTVQSIHKDPKTPTEVKAAMDWILTSTDIKSKKSRDRVLADLYKSITNGGLAPDQFAPVLRNIRDLNRNAVGGEMKGLGEVVVDLASSGTKAQGATLQMLLAKKLLDQGNLHPKAVFELTTHTRQTKHVRKYDLVNYDAKGKPINFESKLWTTPNSDGISSYLSKRSKSKHPQVNFEKVALSQFEKDILINVGEDFRNFRLVIDEMVKQADPLFRKNLLGQMKGIFDNSPALKDLLKKEGRDPALVWYHFQLQYKKNMVIFLGKGVDGIL